MKFGLLLDPLGGAPQEARDRLLLQAQAARDWGFDSVWVDEDDIGPGGQAAAIQVASALAASVSAIRIGVILPLGLSHPLYTAEDIAVLDLISGGRTMVVARLQAPAGRASLATRERFAEALEVCLRAWSPEPFRFQGKHFRVPANLPQNGYAASIAELSVTPKPAQPQVPLWVLATDQAAVDTAAHLRLPLAGPADAPPSALRRRFQRYWQAGGWSRPGAPTLAVRDLAGTGPEEAGRELERYREKLAVNYVVCRLTRPGMSDEEFLAAVRDFGQAVIPPFRMYGYPAELRGRA